VLTRRIIRRLLRPVTLVRTSVFAVGAGIAVNALFLQSGPHPAPFFAAPSGAAIATEPDPLVAAAQRELRRTGYYQGPIDGISGPQTEAAILRFERASGLAATGAIGPELVRAVSTPERREPPPDASEAGAALSTDRVAAIQQALARGAYGPLPADGIVGPQTRDAIRRFQAHHGLPVTGDLTDSLVVELRAVGVLAED
jgi:peptidoglycan hydrolase-like protein with peptidoglycan-binding domain